MRLLLVVILIVAMLGWIGCVLPGSFSTASETVDLPGSGRPIWRRTVNGWERADRWPCLRNQRKIASVEPPIHPLPVAGLMLAGSLAALVFFDPTARVQSTQNPPR